MARPFLLSLLLGLFLHGPWLAAQERRAALVIGNSAYPAAKLPNAVPDAAAVSKALQKAGFTLLAGRKPLQDLTYTGMRGAFSDIKAQADVDLLLIYYAGHAAQHDGEQYLVPVDARLREAADIKDVGISLDSWVDHVIRGKFKHTIIIVDACRSSFPGETTQGARVSGGDKVFVALATSEGKPAADGKAGDHSPFATAFLKALAGPPLPVTKLFHEVQKEVKAVTHGAQEPRLWGDSDTWQSVWLRPSAEQTARSAPTAASAPLPVSNGRNLIDVSRAYVLWNVPQGAPMGELKPAAFASGAVQWLPPAVDTLKPAAGWHRVRVTGWLIRRGKEGREHLVSDGNGRWHVTPQGSGGIADNNSLNLRSETTLDSKSLIAALAEGASVEAIGQSTLDGREWLRCAWSGWIKEAQPPVAFEASLTFTHPARGATISDRTFLYTGVDGPLEMSFINHREDGRADKSGRVRLEGRWEGSRFTSGHQKVLDDYKGWIDETIIVEFKPDFSGGSVTASYVRSSNGRSEEVAATADLMRQTTGVESRN